MDAPDPSPAPSAADRRAWAHHLGIAPDRFGPADADALLASLVADDLPTAFARTADGSPDAPALIVVSEGTADQGAGDDGAPWLTHGELARRAARVHALLARRGVAPGDRVLLCGANSAALVVAYLGLLRAGAVVVLANPAYTRSELEHLVTDSGARHALADPAPAGALEGLVDAVDGLEEDPDPGGTAVPDPATPGGDAVALLAYTSGTTGAPKGVPLTHANLLSSIRAAMLAWRWSARDVLVHALPLSHQHGLGGVHATLLAGSRAVVLPRFAPEDLAAAAARHRATVLFAVPAMYERLAADPAACARLRPALRLAVCGSAPLAPALAERVTHALGHAPLERYGSTEAGLDVSLPLDGPGAPGTVGLPLPGVQMRLRTGDGTPTTEVGVEGEVLLRGPQVFAGYWHAPEATAAAFDDGWFRTGDLGRVEEDTGYLRLTGRLKELIITGGMNVSPGEVEAALDDHPAVAEVGVAGVPSERWGEEVTAWVVPAAGTVADERELLDHAALRLAPYKRPKRVHVVEDLPRNGMGKLQRARLAPPEPPDDAGPAGAPAPDVDTTELDRALARLRRADPGREPGSERAGAP